MDWNRMTQKSPMAGSLGSIKVKNLLTSRATISYSRRTLLHVVSWYIKILFNFVLFNLMTLSAMH